MAVTVADGGVEAAGAEVLRVGRQVEVEHDFRVLGAEAAELRNQPTGAQRRQRSQRQPRFVGVDRLDETGAQRVEGVGRLARDQRAGLRERDALRMAQEQRHADLLFEPAHVVADRSRRGVQLLRRLGKAAESGRGLEGADRHERREAAVTGHEVG
jgi:hypothetical protein